MLRVFLAIVFSVSEDWRVLGSENGEWVQEWEQRVNVQFLVREEWRVYWREEERVPYIPFSTSSWEESEREQNSHIWREEEFNSAGREILENEHPTIFSCWKKPENKREWEVVRDEKWTSWRMTERHLDGNDNRLLELKQEDEFITDEIKDVLEISYGLLTFNETRLRDSVPVQKKGECVWLFVQYKRELDRAKEESVRICRIDDCEVESTVKDWNALEEL